MKKIKFNKNVKLLLFCILSIITINALYTYQDYQNEKNKPEHISSSLNIVKNINDDLSLIIILMILVFLMKQKIYLKI